MSCARWAFIAGSMFVPLLAGCIVEAEAEGDATAYDTGTEVTDEPRGDAIESRASGARFAHDAKEPGEPALELMATTGDRGDDESEDDALDVDDRYDERGEPTPQPWARPDDPGDDEGPDPVPWRVRAHMGPDPVPWHEGEGIEAGIDPDVDEDETSTWR